MDEADVNPMRRRSDADTYHPAQRAHPSHAEGALTQMIEQQTARIPSSVFLVGSFGAILASALLDAAGHERASRFVAVWGPTLLIAGVYNKLVKSLGTS